MGQPRTAQRQGKHMTDLVAAVEKARNSWNEGDLAGYLSLYDTSIRLHGYSPEPMGKAAVKAFYETITAALGEGKHGPPRLVFHEILTDKNLYSCRFTMSGIHRGAFMGVPATGRSYVLGGITILRFAGERVVERWSSADMLGLMIQLGAIPPPAG
jgi:predicted ester cyclase